MKFGHVGFNELCRVVVSPRSFLKGGLELSICCRARTDHFDWCSHTDFGALYLDKIHYESILGF